MAQERSFSELFERWGKGGLIVAFIALLIVGFQAPSARPIVATIVVLGVPLILAALAFQRLRDAGNLLPWAWAIVGVATCAASDVASAHSLFPDPPIDEVTLSGDSADITIPDDRKPFVLDVHGRIAGRERENGAATYTLEIERGHARREIHGTLRREVHTMRARRGPPTTAIARHETAHHDLALDGHGAATLTVLRVNGLRDTLRVTVHGPWMIGSVWIGVFAVLGLVILLLEVAATRAHVWTPLLGIAAASLVLGHYVAFRYDVDEPMVTTIGGLATAAGAGIVGSGVGAVVGALVRRFSSQNVDAQPATASASATATAKAAPAAARRGSTRKKK